MSAEMDSNSFVFLPVLYLRRFGSRRPGFWQALLPESALLSKTSLSFSVLLPETRLSVLFPTGVPETSVPIILRTGVSEACLPSTIRQILWLRK